MKKKYLLLLIFLICFFSSKSQNHNVTFQLDMSTVDPSTFTTPEVNGTFNGWCGSCATMSDPDGDNVWDVTINMTAGSYEFKFSADNCGIQESLLPGSPCTITNFGFTNRSLNVSERLMIALLANGHILLEGVPRSNLGFRCDI